MATDSEPRSASTYLGCGCAAIVALILGGVALMTFLTYRAGKGLEAMAHDPQRAAAAVAEVLPHDELPAGYTPVGTLSVPFLMDVAFLRRGAQADGGEAAGATAGGAEEAAGEGAAAGLSGDDFESGFLFVRIRDWFGRGDKAKAWIESGESDEAPIDQQELRFDPDEVVARGDLRLGGVGVAWVARRGEVKIDTSGFDDEKRAPVKITVDDEDDEPEEGLLTVMSIDCGAGNGWQRIGIWFVPDPAPGTPAADVDWTGTPADPAAIEDMLGHFELCA